MAEDLRRFVSRHAISARRVSPVERGLRRAKGNKTIVDATRKRPSFTLAKVWRAHVRTMVAQKQGDTASVLDALEESDLMRLAGESESYSAFIHFVVGFRHLLEGRRVEAESHLRTSGESAFYGHSVSTRFRALLARLERDPTWPDWLPATPVDSEAK